mmetsp:Transcript_14929/g.37829  ORF Transcript_14929/g.37829 Transcript_14929/m.37829 type:complete len:482 (+) Transcript_14929:307-1752(+)
MATRTSFRPRQVDINRLLPLVRKLEDLDTGDSFASRGVTHGHEALDAENEAILTIKQEKKKVAEIPIPTINTVATYEEDYKPVFGVDEGEKRPYIRHKAHAEEFVDYDMDGTDEKWLARFNQQQASPLYCLEESTLELMIQKLEELSAGNGTSSSSGGQQGKGFRSQAFDVLRGATGCRHSVLQAVYDYWRKKRAAYGMPLLRRLQPPTSASDQNPYAVFRPRDKPHRPQTRRRRENDVSSYEKMKALQSNMKAGRELLACVARRELKKREMSDHSCQLRSVKIRMKHDRWSDAADSEAMVAAKKVAVRQQQESAAYAVEATVLEAFKEDESKGARKKKQKRRDGSGGFGGVPAPVPPIGPPPEAQEISMLFTKRWRLSDLPPSLAPALQEQFAGILSAARSEGGAKGEGGGGAAGSGQTGAGGASVMDSLFARVGRGGRLILERKLAAPAEGEAPSSDDAAATSDYFLSSTYKMYPFISN